MFRVFLFHLIFIAAQSCSNDSNSQKKEAVIPTETKLQQFVLNSNNLSQEQRAKKLDSILVYTAEDSAGFRKTVSFLSKPLSNPNSPYRNEDLYIKILQAQLKSPWYIDAEKTAFLNNLKLVQQNRAGTAANNFTYITPAGETKKMYDINVNHLLLFFYNPECHACAEIKDALTSSSLISHLLKTNQLKILAIYPDKDYTIWQKHLSLMPKKWIHGRDEDEYLWKNKIYDLKAIPTLYLLNKDKKVLLKDAVELSEIERILKDSY